MRQLWWLLWIRLRWFYKRLFSLKYIWTFWRRKISQQTTEVGEEESSANSFRYAADRLNKQLEEILSSPVTKEDIVVFQDIKRYYKSCMNLELIEWLDVIPARYLINLMGGWPVVEGAHWKSANWTWEAALIGIFQNGFSTDILFDFDVQTDLEDSSKRILTVTLF